jgi:uncharacterized protein (DUF983 family)
MPHCPSPVHRKQIIPWHDANAFCLVLVLLMVCVALFGTVGLAVAWENPAFAPHIWLPALLVVLSLLAAAALGVRIIARQMHRRRSASS